MTRSPLETKKKSHKNLFPLFAIFTYQNQIQISSTSSVVLFEQFLMFCFSLHNILKIVQSLE